MWKGFFHMKMFLFFFSSFVQFLHFASPVQVQAKGMKHRVTLAKDGTWRKLLLIKHKQDLNILFRNKMRNI